MCQHSIRKIGYFTSSVFKIVKRPASRPTQLECGFQCDPHGIDVADGEFGIRVVVMEVSKCAEYCQNSIPLVIDPLMVMPLTDGIDYLLDGYFFIHDFSP
jgi:hypothetical protein